MSARTTAEIVADLRRLESAGYRSHWPFAEAADRLTELDGCGDGFGGGRVESGATMTYIEERRAALLAATSALDSAVEALNVALSYGLPRPTEKRIKRIVKRLGVHPGWCIARLAGEGL